MYYCIMTQYTSFLHDLEANAQTAFWKFHRESAGKDTFRQVQNRKAHAVSARTICTLRLPNSIHTTRPTTQQMSHIIISFI